MIDRVADLLFGPPPPDFQSAMLDCLRTNDSWADLGWCDRYAGEVAGYAVGLHRSLEPYFLLLVAVVFTVAVLTLHPRRGHGGC